MTRERVVGRVADHLAAVRAGHPLRVAVDGITAAGKTTFADDVAAALVKRDVPVIRVSMDGFHRPRAERHRQGRESADGYYEDAYDFASFARVLLEPLGPGGSREYRSAVLDLGSDTVLEPHWQSAARDAVLVVDGSFLQRDLAPLWDESIFLAVDFGAARERGVRRDQAQLGGVAAADDLFRRRYHAAGARYLREVEPADRATVLLDVADLDAPRLVRIGGRAGASVSLFSYGTLQQPEVQDATFGRRLVGRSAEVAGYQLDWLTIDDSSVVSASGSARHPVVRATGRVGDVVSGSVLTLTAEELARADLYEVDDYRRRLVDLVDGGQAWMYREAS